MARNGEGFAKNLPGKKFTGVSQYSRAKHLASTVTTLLWLGMMYTMFLFMFDKDERDSYWARQMVKLRNDTSQGFTVGDIQEFLRKPLVATDRMVSLSESISAFISDGLIGGKRTRDGWPIGLKPMFRTLPVTNSAMQTYDLINAGNKRRDYEKFWTLGNTR